MRFGRIPGTKIRTELNRYAAMAAAALLTTAIPASGGERRECLERVGQWAHGPHYAVAADNDHAYFANGGGITVVGVTDQGVPRPRAELSVSNGLWNVVDVEVTGDVVVAVAEEMKVIDVAEPSDPEVVGTWAPPNHEISDVALAGNLAYVAGQRDGLRVVDLSNPRAPIEIASVQLPGWALEVAISDDYAFVWDSDAVLRVVDVRVPARPFVVASVHLPYGRRTQMVYENDFLHLTAGDLRIVDVSNPLAPVVVGEHATPGNFFGFAVEEGVAYLADDWGGMRVVDVSDPSAPFEIGNVDHPTGESARAVAVAAGVAWVADAYHGMRMIDVTDPSAPTQIGFIDTRLATDRFAVADGLLYSIVRENPGMRIIKLGDPESTAEIGILETPWPVADVVVDGSYAYLSAREAGLRIIDVQDPAVPVEVGVLDTPGQAMRTAVSARRAYVADGSSGLRIIDVGDPADPFELGASETPVDAMSVLIAGDVVYVADDETGLRVFDVIDPRNPTEIGFLAIDTFIDDLALSDDLLLIAARHLGPRIVDVSDPADPVEIGNTSMFTYSYWIARAVALEGAYAYVVYEIPTIWGFPVYSLVTLGLTDPSDPIMLGERALGGSAGSSVAVDDRKVFVSVGERGVEIVTSCAPPPPRGPTGRVVP